MRKPHDRRTNPISAMILRFLAIFVITLVVLAAAWPILGPVYTRMAAAVARLGFHVAEPTQISVVEAQGAELWIYRIVGPGQITPFTWFDRYTFFAVIPLIALFAATPGLGFRRRLTRLAAGLVLLFLVQTSYIVISVQLTYATLGLTAVGSLAARMLDEWQTLVRVLWEAAPLVLWVAFTAGTWARRLKALRKDWKTYREACGKGLDGLRTEATKGWES